MLTNLTSFFIRDLYCYQQVIVDQAYGPVPLILYSHIPTAIITLMVGIFMLTKNKKLETQIFFFLALTFFLFTLGDFIEWFMFVGRGPVMFARSIIELLDPVLFILSSYFLFVLVKKRDIRLIYKIIWLIPLIPLIIRVFLNLNLTGYDWQICEVIESSFSSSYIYYIDLFYMVSAIIFAIWSIIKAKGNRKEITIASTGVCIFIILFFVMEYVFTGYILGGVFDYNYFLYAFFGMPVLIGFLGYLIVKYKEFNVKLLGTQALVWGLIALIGAQFFFIKVTINFILTGVTFIASITFGYFLVRSVKKEIQQKEELAKLNIDLHDSIKQRESLVHLVTHKVKGSFTRSKYIFAGILDGTFGEVSPDIKKYAEQGLESDNMGIETVDLVLNADNLQKGTVKYDMKPTDFKDIVVKTLEEKRVPIEAKGLKIENTIKDGNYNVLGDAFWLKEAVHNLIENSVKYTKIGEITVGLENGNGKVKLYVKDTGVGINEEDKKSLFTEGGRGRDSVKVNVDSTGYGLYTVKLVIEAHKGKVWAESEGTGKGSTFFIELPAV